MALESLMRKADLDLRNSVKESIDSSRFRKIDDLPNGDKLVHDLRSGYVIDGATGNIKGWKVKTGALGGSSYWVEADFCSNGVIGPGSRRGLFPKPPVVYR